MGLHKKNNSKLRLLLYGGSSQGKTHFVATAADVGDTLLISYHAQPDNVAEREYKHKLVVWDLDELTQLDMIFEHLVEGKGRFTQILKANKLPSKFKFVIFDGFSVLQATYLQIILRPDLKADKPKFDELYKVVHQNRASIRDYGELLMFTNSIGGSFWSLANDFNYNVIITAYERTERATPTVMGELGRVTAIKPAIIGSGINQMMGKSNVLARIEWDGQVSKLRIRQSKTIAASFRLNNVHTPKTSILLDADIQTLMYGK